MRAPGCRAGGGRNEIGTGEVMDELLRYLENAHGPLAYLLLAAAAAVEYVFPPFPGDTIVLFGAFLAATADYNPFGVYAVLSVGSMIGAMAAYAFGRRFDDVERWPRWLRGKRAEHAFGVLRERFEKYGAAYLLANRFLPALRAFFFVSAGLARMPVLKVLVYGGISALAWNALLLGVGYAAGKNWDRLVRWSEHYTAGVLALVALVVIALVLRWWIARKRRQG